MALSAALGLIQFAPQLLRLFNPDAGKKVEAVANKTANTTFIFAFGWLPILVLRWGPPGDFRGFTRLFLLLIIPLVWVQIHPKYWDDPHILVHELQHVEDYLRNPFLYWFRYQTHEGRLHFEVRAFARQYLSYGAENETRFDHFVHLICTKYDLSLNRDFVGRVLRGEIDHRQTG